MTDPKKEPIRAPERTLRDNRRRVARTFVEVAAQANPITAGLARILQTTHPPAYDQKRDEWQGAITERTNEHTARLDDHDSLLAPTVTLEGTPVKLLVALARACPDGMHSKFYSLDELCTLVPDEDRQAIEDAAYECIHHGLAEKSAMLSGPLRIRLTDKFYEQIDPPVMGWVPADDAKILALLMLERGRERTADLHAASGMDRRQFNPAFRHLLRYLEASDLGGLISREVQPDYPSSSVCITAEVRAALRRLAGSSHHPD